MKEIVIKGELSVVCLFGYELARLNRVFVSEHAMTKDKNSCELSMMMNQARFRSVAYSVACLFDVTVAIESQRCA